MVPYVQRYIGQYSSVVTYGDGEPPVVEVGPRNYADYIDFAVGNGLVKGDKHSPNPHFFQKTRSYAMLYDRSISSTYNSAHGLKVVNIHSVDDASGADWSLSARGALYFGLIPWASLADRVSQRIYDQMRFGKGNLVVDLAEARETIKMIRNATSVRKLVKNFMKEVVRPSNLSGSRRLKFATDKWLEYRYGWLPLVSSTYELLKTLSSRVNKATTVDIHARAAYMKQWIEDNSHQGEFTWAKDTRNIELSVRHMAKYRMRSRTTLDLYDFTSLNPLGIAWELTPLSFVADWFTSVGDTLQLWEDHFWFANRFVSGFQTDTIKEDVIRVYDEHWVRGTPPTGTAQYTSFDKVMKARRLVREKNRFLVDRIPAPGGPRIEVNLNAKRLLDAASLIRGAFGNPRLK